VDLDQYVILPRAGLAFHQPHAIRASIPIDDNAFIMVSFSYRFSRPAADGLLSATIVLPLRRWRFSCCVCMRRSGLSTAEQAAFERLKR
jgi:hypothetical protein